MNTQIKTLAGTVLMGSMALVGCNSSDDSSPAPQTSQVSLGLSDAPVEGLSNVFVEIDYIELRRGGEITRIDTFMDDDIDEDSDTFTIDLLAHQGTDRKIVFEDLELVVGEYQGLRLGVKPNQSYVVETEGGLEKQIKVPSNVLKLGGFEITDQSTQTFVVEFDLRQAMTYNPGPDRYILKPRGVRIVGVEDAATLAGTITTLDSMNTLGICADKADAEVGNIAYLYAGHDLNSANLGDVFVRDDASSEDDAEVVEVVAPVPEQIIAPFAATAIDETGAYLFAYLPAGNYTLALSCDAADDDPLAWNQIPIPAPDVPAALVEITLSAGQAGVHNFTFEAAQPE